VSIFPLSTHERKAPPVERSAVCPASTLELTTTQLKVWAGATQRFRAGRPDLEHLDDRAILGILGLPGHLAEQVLEYIASGEADEEVSPCSMD